MGVDVMKIGVQIRKVMAFLIRTFYRSVCNHPFLVVSVCFMIFLYRSSPFVFSLLVSASPILVCTAVLLGTLLSFGQPNIAEIEKEEKVTTHEISSLKTGVVGDATVVERDENKSFETIERYTEPTKNALDEPILEDNKGNEIKEDRGSFDLTLPLIGVNSREIQWEKRVIVEVEREYNDLELDNKRQVDEEKPRIEEKLNDGGLVDNQYSRVGAENLGLKDDKSPRELIDPLKEDQLGFAPGLSWKPGGEDYGDNDGADGDESLDSGSDGAESSSSDASMTDILPMLDELHPLLEFEAPGPTRASIGGSNAGSQRLHKSDDESVDSEEDSDNQVEEGEGEDDNDDNEDEEEEGEAVKGGEEDESKSAIKWTEVDQKNLMDLGTSEIERNQRLENLIARRRARKNFRLMAEKNLIDLEVADFPFNIPSIATTRRNPFEVPDDTYENMAIPGSAPSILLPRRNPFDLPYDSNEEKPDLKGDSFQQEFSVFQHKEPVYRRNETFSMGASVLGGPKQERQDFRWRRYFVAERFSSEEGTGYPTFQRQLSENSESKVSSVPDTESVNSAVDEEDKQSHEQIPKQFSSEGTSCTTFKRQVSEISESKVSSVPDTESISSAVDEEENKLNEEVISREMEVISNIGHVVDRVECGSQSSGEVGSVDTKQAAYKNVHREVVEITLGDGENHHEKESSFSGTEGTSTPEEFHANEIHQKTETFDENSSSSSLSSLSQVDEKILDARKEEGSTTLEPGMNLREGSGVSTHIMPEEPEFHFMSGVTEQMEPVYDSSPQGLEKFLSFTSISSDTQPEIAEMVSSSVLLRSADTESEAHREDRDNGSTSFEEMLAAPSQFHAVDENKSVLREETFTEAGELSVRNVRCLGIDPNIDVQKGFIVSSYSLDIGPPEEYTVYRGDHFLPNEGDSVAPTHQTTTVDSSSSWPELQMPSMVIEHILEHPSVSSPETEPVEEQAEDKADLIEPEKDEVHTSSSSDKKSVEEAMTDKDSHFQHEADQVHSLSFDADIPVDGDQDGREEVNPPILTEQIPIVHLSLSCSEVDHVQDHSLDKEKSCQLDEGQVQSTSLEKIDSGIHQNLDAKVDSDRSIYEYIPSEEKSPFELEKQSLLVSDQSLSYDDQDATQEASIILVEPMEEVNIANNANVSEVHDHGEKTLKNSSSLISNSTTTPPFQSPDSRSSGGEGVNKVDSGNAFDMHDHEHMTQQNSSPLTPDTSSTIPFENPQDKPPVGEDVQDEILERVVHGDPVHIKEHFDNSVEVYDHDVNEENTNGEVQEIKEIDEELLLELDRVGDFSVKEEVVESCHIQPTPEETNISNSELLPDDLIPLETSLDLPVLEAKSMQDIFLAFKQLHKGVDLEEVILPSTLNNQVVMKESKDPGTVLPVVEARSVEDIHTALKQVSQSNLGEVPKPLLSNDCAAEVAKIEVASTEQIESSANRQSAVQEKRETAAAVELKHVSKETSETSNSGISDEKENTVNQYQVRSPVENEAPVIQTENEVPKLH